MEYSKDIILGINYTEGKNGQVVKRRTNLLNLVKEHKIVATISVLCGILILLDCILVCNFIKLLQTL